MYNVREKKKCNRNCPDIVFLSVTRTERIEMDSLIPIVAILSTFGVPAIVVIVIVLISHRNKIARYNVIERAMESNVSPEVMEQLINSISEEDSRKNTPPKQKHLMHGTLLIALGISFFVMRFIIGGTDLNGLLAAGAVLTMLALAKFIIAFFIVGKTPGQP